MAVMRGASPEPSNGPRRLFRAIAAAAICAITLANPAAAQFEFLFGRSPEAKPPPAPESKPAESKGAAAPGSRTRPSKGQYRKSKSKNTVADKPQAQANASRTEEPLPPYDPELLRLAEILGALTYLDGLCTTASPRDWRANMQALLDAEAKTNVRRERLAGSYNRGFRDYERTYHFCTPNAQVAIGRFLAEGSRIAHEVVNRYGAS
jgi:uncharacterized protein (TIGR02301 family)